MRLFTNLTGGLPNIPATLLALAGVSVTAYGTKKALEKDLVPEITTTIPRKLVLTRDASLTVAGSGFLSPGGDPTDLNGVFLNEVKLPTASWTPTRVVATLPVVQADLEAMGLAPDDDVSLVVQDEAGRPSDSHSIKLERGPAWI